MTYKQCVALMAALLSRTYPDPALSVQRARELWAEMEYQVDHHIPEISSQTWRRQEEE